jgi:hypothetical protein
LIASMEWYGRHKLVWAAKAGMGYNNGVKEH